MGRYLQTESDEGIRGVGIDRRASAIQKTGDEWQLLQQNPFLVVFPMGVNFSFLDRISLEVTWRGMIEGIPGEEDLVDILCGTGLRGREHIPCSCCLSNIHAGPLARCEPLTGRIKQAGPDHVLKNAEQRRWGLGTILRFAFVIQQSLLQDIGWHGFRAGL